MKLPQHKYSVFTTIQPSTGKKIKFRQYTVDEEETLILAAESEDYEHVKTTLIQLIKACVQDDAYNDDWTSFDVEWVYLQIRAKSLSNFVDISFQLNNCPQKEDGGICETANLYRINIDELKLSLKNDEGVYADYDYKAFKPKSQIMINDTQGVQLRFPGIKDIEVLEDEKEASYRLIARCTEAIFDGDEVTEIEKDADLTELIAWYKKLDRHTIEKLDAFFDKSPTIVKDCEFKCRKCGKTKTETLEGLQSFFG